MAHRDVVAQNQRIRVAHHMQHGAVLNICARPDAHEIHVPAQDGARPHAGMLADDDVKMCIRDSF